LNTVPFRYCQWLPTLFIGGFVALSVTIPCVILVYSNYCLHVIVNCYRVTDIFVMLWIYRQFIGGKDWNW